MCRKLRLDLSVFADFPLAELIVCWFIDWFSGQLTPTPPTIGDWKTS